MKIKLSQSQWKEMGKKAGWIPPQMENNVDLAHDSTIGDIEDKISKLLHPDARIFITRWLLKNKNVAEQMFKDLNKDSAFGKRYIPEK